MSDDDQECFACENGIEAYIEQAHEHIAQYGWTIVGVMSDPVFVYSVGMSQFGLPEIMLVGNFPPMMMQQMVNTIGFYMKDKGALKNLERVEGLFGCPVIFRELTKADIVANCGMMTNILGTELDCRMLHAIFPDKHGRFPWEPPSVEGQMALKMTYVSPVAAALH
jgi:hypothetical protein